MSSHNGGAIGTLEPAAVIADREGLNASLSYLRLDHDVRKGLGVANGVRHRLTPSDTHKVMHAAGSKRQFVASSRRASSRPTGPFDSPASVRANASERMLVTSSVSRKSQMMRRASAWQCATMLRASSHDAALQASTPIRYRGRASQWLPVATIPPQIRPSAYRDTHSTNTATLFKDDTDPSLHQLDPAAEQVEPQAGSDRQDDARGKVPGPGRSRAVA